jgi:lipid-binding SYLF domain-containing protein
MRTGLWVSGAGGSGVLIAKKEDGSWSPPSGILIHTLGVGFMAGIDIYDCVCVINNREALKAFSKLRVSLGPEVSVVAGPVGAGGIVDTEILKDHKPVYSYMKSRGLYAGLQFDGTIIIERNDENARFYGERLPVGAILAGQVRMVPAGTRMLMEVVKEAEGRTDVNQAVLNEVAGKPSPGDVEVESVIEPTKEQREYYSPPASTYRPGESSSYQPDVGYAHPPRTDSGFPAPPPGAPSGAFMSGAAGSASYTHPPRTDSGFAAPPPGQPPSYMAAQAPPSSSEYPPEKPARWG